MSEEFDVGAVHRGAQKAYNLAPNPVFFLLLTRAVLGSIAELQREWDELPEDVRKVHENWQANLVKYKARVFGEQLQAKKIVNFIESGNEDWQEGLKKGTAYANALHSFFLGGDSAKWANLANQLAEVKEWYVKENPFIFPRWTRPVFFFAVWNPMLLIPAASTALALEAASGPVSEFASEAAEAAEETLDDVGDFLKDVGVGILVISAIGLLLFIALKARS